jgi:dihydropteroate synthase
MSLASRPLTDWQLRTRSLALGAKTVVMAILNVTPDSFSEGAVTPRGEPETLEATLGRALKLLDEGAHILDIGGESTRPGSHAATAAAIGDQQERDRVLPVIEAVLSERPGTLLSIDTYRASTARAAVAAGCEIVNDVSGLLWDREMARACAELGCGVVLMHTRGRPDEWCELPSLEPAEVLPMVQRELGERLALALETRIAKERIVLDPGYGFGKAFDANYSLLAGQAELLSLGRPLLAGVSRKSFLGRTLGHALDTTDLPPLQRGYATIAATVAAVLAGASLVRVHDVRPAVEAVAIADAVLAASGHTAEA